MSRTLFLVTLAIAPLSGYVRAAIIVPPAATAPVVAITEDEQFQDKARTFERMLEKGEPLDFKTWAEREAPHLLTGDQNLGGQEGVVVEDLRDRPGLYLGENDFAVGEKVPELWFDTISERRAMIARVSRSVGRIEVYGLESTKERIYLGELAGTGFVISNSIVITNRHVASVFADRQKGFRTNLDTGVPADVWVNFSPGGRWDRTKVFRVIETIFPETNRDVALLRVSDPEHKLPSPLKLASEQPIDKLEHRKVVVCGYPVLGFPFFRIPGVKRVSPGTITALLEGELPARLLLHHDSSTAEGSSGSPVVDLDTGRVLGIHFRNNDTSNVAEPMWEVRSLTEIQSLLGPAVTSLGLSSVTTWLDLPERPALLVDRDGKATDLSRAVEASFPKATVKEAALSTAARAVALVHVVATDGTVSPTATGLVVAPGWLLFPVFGDHESGRTYSAAFGRTYDSTKSSEVPVHVTEVIRSKNDGEFGFALGRIGGQEGIPAPKFDLGGSYSPGEPVAVVGFHFRDARVDDGVLRTIFLGPLGVKRLSPGFLLQAPDGTLRYDASTLGGSSGSPIVSLATGKVIGIHLSGTDDANLGITVKELQKKLASLTELLTK